MSSLNMGVAEVLAAGGVASYRAAQSQTTTPPPAPDVQQCDALPSGQIAECVSDPDTQPPASPAGCQAIEPNTKTTKPNTISGVTVLPVKVRGSPLDGTIRARLVIYSTGNVKQKFAVTGYLQEGVASTATPQTGKSNLALPLSLAQAFETVMMTDANLVVFALHGAMVSAGKEKNADTAPARDQILFALLDKIGQRVFDEADIHSPTVGLTRLISTARIYANKLPLTTRAILKLADTVNAEIRDYDTKYFTDARDELRCALSDASPERRPAFTRRVPLTQPAEPRPGA